MKIDTGPEVREPNLTRTRTYTLALNQRFFELNFPFVDLTIVIVSVCIKIAQ
jgi:hypothetical protein